MFSKIDKKYYYDGALGAAYSEKETTFRVWSPLAESAALLLYVSGGENQPERFPMKMNPQGVWEYTASGNLEGCFYTYEISHDGNAVETIDIYAKACGVNGEKGMVVNLSKTNPDGWEEQKHVPLSHPTDAVLYELHVRDFSIDESGNFLHRGKYLAFAEQGVRSRTGQSTGIDHLTELGITHVHLLPVFDFQSVDEAGGGAPFNWGYDPQNFNIPEGSYATDPYDGSTRIRELKTLILALHNAGIGVIMDVVYNHTYNLDSAFHRTFPRYYYRSFGRSYANGSGCGNEVATHRSMAAKFIVDSVCFWAQEYRLDGFRFDLMGLYDTDCVNAICHNLRRIRPDILLYGEGWTAGNTPLSPKKRAVKANATKVPGVAMFSDDFRDAVKGDAFHAAQRGFVSGESVSAETIKSVMIGGVAHPDVHPAYPLWTDSPAQAVNYVEAHDNYTLWDKLCLSCPEASDAKKIAMNKLAAAMVFLAQGIPFMQAGQEFLRSKPLLDGYDENSYRSLDCVNSLKWNRKTEFSEVYAYYRGLIAIRKSCAFFRMRSGEEIRRRIRFEEKLPDGVIGIVYDNRAVLYLNASEKPLWFPAGHYKKVLADSLQTDRPRPAKETEFLPAKSILLMTV